MKEIISSFLVTILKQLFEFISCPSDLIIPTLRVGKFSLQKQKIVKLFDYTKKVAEMDRCNFLLSKNPSYVWWLLLEV